MEIRNKVTKRGVVEALTLSRWLQPFVQADDFELEKSNIVTMSDASFALNNYYLIEEEDKELTDEELDTLPCSDTKH
jgi:hypothetical protein